jgi:hypothetical protein
MNQQALTVTALRAGCTASLLLWCMVLAIEATPRMCYQ